MKIRPVGTELFHADGRTDITKVIVALRNFVNAPKNCKTVTGPPYEVFGANHLKLKCGNFTAAYIYIYI
jgi:hypothetical protein